METIITMGINKLTMKKEKFQEDPLQIKQISDSVKGKLQQENIYTKIQGVQSTKTNASSVDRITSMLFIIFWVMLGVLSAYLSWSSNTLIQWETHFKVIFALGAFLFPIYYLLMFFIGKLSLIRYIQSRGC